MSLGQEFAEFVAELVNTDGDFGSLMTWRHVNRTENQSTGAVTETAPTDETFRGAVTDLSKVRLFGDDTLAESIAGVVVPAVALTTPPRLVDRVSIDGTQFRVVLDWKPVHGPGDAGPAVLICYVVALGGVVEEA